jgi:DNA polymerase-3 subunit alpha
MGFPGYFLIVADFINWAKNNGVPVGPGRGSGAGSLVAYSLASPTSIRSPTPCCSSAS